MALGYHYFANQSDFRSHKRRNPTKERRRPPPYSECPSPDTEPPRDLRIGGIRPSIHLARHTQLAQPCRLLHGKPRNANVAFGLEPQNQSRDGPSIIHDVVESQGALPLRQDKKKQGEDHPARRRHGVVLSGPPSLGIRDDGTRRGILVANAELVRV